jgi:hypothetical protein
MHEFFEIIHFTTAAPNLLVVSQLGNYIKRHLATPSRATSQDYQMV